MAIDVPKTVGQLPTLSSPNGNTQVVVNHTANSVTNTYIIAIKDLLSAIPGPYANDTVAANNSVANNRLYYDSNGLIHIRLS